MARSIATFAVVVLTLGCTSPNNEQVNEPGDSMSAVIGSEGGELTASLADGSTLLLDIPPDALFVETEITLTPSALDESSWARLEVSPAGLKFRQPVEIVATRKGRAIGAHDIIQFEFGERSIPLPSRLDSAASTLSAQTMRLGYALDDEPADNLRRQALGRGNVIRLSEMDCAARLQSASDTLDELVSQPGLEDLAVALYETQVSILGDLNCALEEAVRNTIGLVACSHYEEAVELASLTLPTDEQEFAGIVRPILHWTAEARAAGMDCTEDFGAVLEREGSELIAHYDGQLAARTSNSWVLVRRDSAALFSMWEVMAVLGLSEIAETVGLGLFTQLVDRLRQVTYATSQDQDDVLSLTYCTQSGFGRDRPIIGVEPEVGGGNPGYPFSFSDADIFADIQYALSSVTFTSRSATGNEVGSVTLGGGTSPGVEEREGAILIVENGEVTLSGRVLSLACWDGSDLDADDELIVSINGTEFERLTTASLRANFLATDVTWTTSEILDRLGTTFVTGDVYTMTVTRTRALTDAHMRYCDEQLMGPAEHELFSVDLVTDDGAGLDLSAFRGTYAGTCAEVESGTCYPQEYEGQPIQCWATVDAVESGLRVRFTHQYFPSAMTGCAGGGWRFDEFLLPADSAPVVAIPLEPTFRGAFCDSGVTVINRDYALEPAAQPPHLRGEITEDGTFGYEYEASMSDFCLYYRPVLMEKCAETSIESTGASPPCP